MLKQSQSQKLLQKLSPQQIQLMKLLQIPTASLEERIKEELEENPALEYSTEDGPEDEYKLGDDGPDSEYDQDTDDVELSEDTADKVDLDDFLRHEDDYGSGDYRDDYYGGGDEERQPIPVRVETSFHEHLLGQLGMLELDERGRQIAEQIIGSIDEDGYLRREPTALVDDLAFGHNIQTTVEELQGLIDQIQNQFDPPGVCAWTLQECLLLQLRRQHPQTPSVKNAIAVIELHYNTTIKSRNTWASMMPILKR